MILRFLLLGLCLGLNIHAVEKHDPFVVVTPPKAGTHLLTKTMEKLTGRKCLSIFSSFVLSHEEWIKQLDRAKREHGFIQIHGRPDQKQIDSLKKLDQKVIFIIRDPRDQALSLFNFIEDKKWSYGALNLELEPYKSLSYDDRLHEIITGARTGCSGVKKLFVRYLPWTYESADFVYTTRYEDLVGTEGGGSRKRQLNEVKKIARFLNMNLSDEELDARSKGLYGKPGEKTFRTGRIGEWRYHFKFLHYHAMKLHFGKIMNQMGYPPGILPIKQEPSNAEIKKQRQKKKQKERETVVVEPPH